MSSTPVPYIHTPVLIEQKQTHDMAIALKFRCCGNPKTDVTQTLYGVDQLQQSDIDSAIAQGKTTVQTKHQALMNAQAYIQGGTGIAPNVPAA